MLAKDVLLHYLGLPILSLAELRFTLNCSDLATYLTKEKNKH